MSQTPFDTETLKAFAHPLRIKIHDRLSSYGSATATQLAEVLHESTGQTSYHLRILAKYGLVEDDPEVEATGRERWWRAVRNIRMTPDVLTDPAVRAASELVLSQVAQGRAETLQDWFQHASKMTGPWLENNITHRATTHLTPEEAGELIEKVTELIDGFLKRHDENSPPQDAKRVRVYFDVFPLL